MAEIDTTEIDEHLWQLWDQKGTDLLFTAGVPPLLRMNGTMGPAEGAPVLAAADTERIVSSLLPPAVAEEFAHEKDVDFSFGWGDRARFRGNVFHQQGTMGLSLRLIPFEIPTFEELGLPPIVERSSACRRGWCSSPARPAAGKSTTLAVDDRRINPERRCHILTIEDPIEYVHVAQAGRRQPARGRHRHHVASPRRCARRCGRTPTSCWSARCATPRRSRSTLTIAETGHLVFATLHTNDAAQAVDRIVDVFPAERQRRSGCSSQRRSPASSPSGSCRGSAGAMVAAFEVLVATHAVRNLIREGKSNQLRNVMLTGSEDGMQTLEASLSELVLNGVVTYEDAVARSLSPKEVARPPGVLPVDASSA